ncbi:MAG: hypothetical protein ACRC6V_03000 [Bacteroidales bacterium]
MIVCPHDGCDYATGWTHRGSELNRLLNPPEGDFFELRSSVGHHGITAYRWDDNLTGVNIMRVLGCPKCLRTFITSGQVYLD